ncbi:MAG: hypothetical protein CO113_04705 [Elusimicrobia bacterium CG_4_9_14_3_um_filter_62_55]|nr:MAG: hypothetical protein COR54_13075 [Elusimicrobia bacterium CG22_combo_CG10-13_8_21_14_all_63_91]PJA16130.1 MAG: hypothetical protein COX66_08550 [Elusimicrobia bacterium CG_4_10_14_0_2_um_filter_63_34]PJB26198.1 MAG: hypothetical protein CO113_04705 [Elusimicrobia bacterium CG_4_9_14_3_um_filter_62_55]
MRRSLLHTAVAGAFVFSSIAAVRAEEPENGVAAVGNRLFKNIPRVDPRTRDAIKNLNDSTVSVFQAKHADSPVFRYLEAGEMKWFLDRFHIQGGGRMPGNRTPPWLVSLESRVKSSPEFQHLPQDQKIQQERLLHEHVMTMLVDSLEVRHRLLGTRTNSGHDDPGAAGDDAAPALTPEQTPVEDATTASNAKIEPLKKEALLTRENYYTGLERIEPNNPIAPAGKANALQERGDNRGAWRAYTRALDLGGETSSVRSRRARSAFQLGDYKSSYEDARRALELDPNNQEAFAIAKLTRGRSGPSDMNVKRIAFSDPRGAERLAAASGESTAPTSDSGFGGFEPGKAPPPETMSAADYAASTKSQALTREALTAMRVNDRKKAESLLRKAIQTAPKQPEAYANLASLLLDGRRYDPAIEVVETGLREAPESPSLWTARSLVMNRRGKYEEALRDASKAISYDKRAAGGWFMRAFANAGLRDRRASLTDLQEAARLDRRFREKLKRAKALPEDFDPLLLFDPMLAEGRAAPKVPEKPQAPWPYLVFGLIAAGLAAIGLRTQPVRERLTAFRRKGEPEPTTASDEIYPDSGFWKGYRIERKIAAGGMGVVYEAVDTRLDRRVAIKCMREEIRDDARERERFLAEARLVAKLRHRGIVAINGIEEDDGEVYLVFEYVEGRTLHEALVERGRLSLIEARDLFREVCEALEFAHAKGVVHRDLKPANIMITVDGEVKVMDFGVARQAQEAMEHLARTNTIVGTPPYMSPEQEEGRVGKAADIYALGVCLYEALSGAQPFVGTYAGQLLQKREGKFERITAKVEGLPPGVDGLLAAALHPDPEKRIGSASEFARRLAEISDGAPTPPPAARA